MSTNSDRNTPVKSVERQDAEASFTRKRLQRAVEGPVLPLSSVQAELTRLWTMVDGLQAQVLDLQGQLDRMRDDGK